MSTTASSWTRPPRNSVTSLTPTFSTTTTRSLPMPRKDLTTSTDMPDSFSGGVSRIVFTRRCGPNLFQVTETVGGDPQLQLLMTQRVLGGYVEHLVNFHCLETSGELDFPEPL